MHHRACVCDDCCVCGLRSVVGQVIAPNGNVSALRASESCHARKRTQRSFEQDGREKTKQGKKNCGTLCSVPCCCSRRRQDDDDRQRPSLFLLSKSMRLLISSCPCHLI